MAHHNLLSPFDDLFADDGGSNLDLFSDDSIFSLNSSSPSSLTFNNNDPFLTPLSRSTSNVLEYIVDLPQKSTQDPMSDQSSPVDHTVINSPYHQSDSGVSDVNSVVQSPEHYIFDNQTDSVPATSRTMIDSNEIDTELAAYFNSDNEMLSPSHSNPDLDDLPFFSKSIDAEPFLDVVSGDLTDRETPESLQSSHQSIRQSTCNRPSEVKILKVVRPSNTSEGVTSEDIAKAMEERSKKNAVQAKMNREKKKAYIQSLENDLEKLRSSNGSLSLENARMKKELGDKDEEIEYLKSVLANASALSGLLKNISEVKEVKLSATIMSRKRVASEDHSYNLVENTPQKRARLIDENLKKAGVCLHVKGATACLEFCAHCSKQAQKSYAHS